MMVNSMETLQTQIFYKNIIGELGEWFNKNWDLGGEVKPGNSQQALQAHRVSVLLENPSRFVSTIKLESSGKSWPIL